MAFNPTALKSVASVADLSDNKGKRSAKATVLEGIKTQLKLFADPKAEGRRWFRSGATDTAFSVKYGTTALKLKGDETQLAVETKLFPEAMAYFSKEVEAGKFDDQLKALEAGRAARVEKMRATRAAKPKKERAETPKS